MAKDRSYHETAIKYNAKLAECAENLAPELEDPEIRKWCIGVGKQHRFHEKRHQAALEKIVAREAEVVEVEQIPDGLDVPELVISEAVVVESEEPVLLFSESESVALGDEETDVVLETFDDGCVGHHKPIEPNCEFNPANKPAEGLVTDA